MKKIILATSLSLLLAASQGVQAAVTPANNGAECRLNNECRLPAPSGDKTYFKVNKDNDGDKFKCLLRVEDTSKSEPIVVELMSSTGYMFKPVNATANPNGEVNISGKYLFANNGEIWIKHLSGQAGFIKCFTSK